jgi:ribosomal-protein-serine acetyltransferase
MQVDIREYKIEDAQKLFELIDKNRKHLYRFIWVDSIQSVIDVEDFIKRSINLKQYGTGYEYGIYADEELVGNVSLYNVNKSHGRAGIGYWVSQDYEGQGIVHRAVDLLIENAFMNLGLHKLTISCAVNNEHSAQLAKKLGFVEEGLLREDFKVGGEYVDSHVFGFLKSEFLKSRNLA